ncbi:MAG TPA: hypothetical protein VJL56_01930 [Candidatus Bathyarchaeia archaeon]|nr:hypothetical protein [Candidatus Bathyarchaeia archaeon]
MLLALALATLALTGIGPLMVPAHMVWVRQVGNYSTGVSVTNSALYVVSAGTIGLPNQVSKYDFDGNLLWTHTRAPNAGYLAAIASGPDALYLVGRDANGFLEKYDFDGNLIWQRHIDVSGESVSSNDVSVGPNAIYASGLGPEDGLVVKFDAAGNRLWTHQFTFGYVGGVSAGPKGVYVVGTACFILRYCPHSYGFVMAIDTNGNEIWTRDLSPDYPSAVSAGPAGVYVSGERLNAPGQGYGIVDTFIRRYDFNGNEVWTRTFGFSDSYTNLGWLSQGPDEIYAVGSIVCGICQKNSGLVVHVDHKGNKVWALPLEEEDSPVGIAVSAKEVFITGLPSVVALCVSPSCASD